MKTRILLTAVTVFALSSCANHSKPICTAKASEGGGNYADVVIYSIKNENGYTYVRAGEPFGGLYISTEKLKPGNCPF